MSQDHARWGDHGAAMASYFELTSVSDALQQFTFRCALTVHWMEEDSTVYEGNIGDMRKIKPERVEEYWYVPCRSHHVR